MGRKLTFFAGVLVVSVAGAVLTAQTPGERGYAGADWPLHYGDQAATRFSTLDQIDATNVAGLERAWTFRTESGRFASPPMIVDSVMYFSAPNGVYAVDAVTGTQLWKYAPPAVEPPAEGAGGGGRGGRGGGRGGADSAGTATRGPVYWPGNETLGPRIYSTTSLGMAAIDAATGELVETFGEGGVLAGVRPRSPAVIYQNVLITHGEEEPGRGNTVQAWDVLSGAPVWTFYLKAQEGDPNRASWITGWEESSGPGLWGYFTLDEGRGTLYVPVEKVGNDYWGGPHHGNNLYSDSLVALDALTGEMEWFQQLVHHDIWDYDLSAAPALIDVRRDGEVIPAVVQQTKMALLFIFNRETGEPIFGIEERPVPQTTVDGEWTSPTQPFPIKPEPLARNTISRDELSRVTPEHQAFCEGLWDKYELQASGPYEPWRTDRDIVVYPGAQGGGNWHGVAFNPELGLIFTNVMTAGQWGRLVPGGRGRGAASAPLDGPQPMGKRTPEGGRFWDPEKQWDCSNSPWGELVAVDASTGDIAWRVPLGEYEELAAKGIITGTPQAGGAITTAGGLVFIGATTDSMFRAFDARTGEMLWSDTLPASAHTTPATYVGRDGRQYVVVGANGGSFFRSPASDEIIAYALP